MKPAALLAAALAAILGGWLIAVAVSGPAHPFPTPQPIPLPAAALATPVTFPNGPKALEPPPIRDAPLFVSTANTPIPLSDWHRETLKLTYIADGPPTPYMGRN